MDSMWMLQKLIRAQKKKLLIKNYSFKTKQLFFLYFFLNENSFKCPNTLKIHLITVRILVDIFDQVSSVYKDWREKCLKSNKSLTKPIISISEI